VSTIRAWIESKRWHQESPSDERFAELSAAPEREQPPDQPLRPFLPASTPGR
jgi:hypothetical protein